MRKNLRPELAHAREQGFYNISEAAERSGVSARMIRNYERVGLVPAAGRTFAGYRIYSDSDVGRFRFIRRARALGFSIKQIDTLLSLWNDQSRASAEVQRVVLAHADALSVQLRQIRAMRQMLRDLACRCQGNKSVECPILRDLASPPGASIVDGHGGT